VRCIRNFFLIRFESKRIWIFFASYLHASVYSKTPFILRIIHFIFASKYSHKFECKYSICCKTNTFSHTGEYLLQNISLEANVRKTLSEFHIQANTRIQTNIRLQLFAYKRIFACKYSHTTEFSFCIASNYKGQPFTILGLNYLSVLYDKMSLNFASKYSL
jgi:hypothetical protein